jgi:hypothetical protein
MPVGARSPQFNFRASNRSQCQMLAPTRQARPYVVRLREIWLKISSTELPTGAFGRQ